MLPFYAVCREARGVFQGTRGTSTGGALVSAEQSLRPKVTEITRERALKVPEEFKYLTKCGGEKSWPPARVCLSGG